ncbi:hypothetical protein, partial [Brevibacterium sp. FME37]|uniref:hypothetical protein n=1 Tax=Brevibacterium sp. FME37 TaxID=2742607 RepID=UPI001D023CC9
MTDVLIGYSYFFIDFMSHLPQQATLRVSPVPAQFDHHLGPLRLPRHTEFFKSSGTRVSEAVVRLP